MKNQILKQSAMLSAAICLCASSGVVTVFGQDESPKYKADVPNSILTPDSVDTAFLGTLKSSYGMPSKDSTAKVYDFLDVSRGVEAFLSGMTAASVHGMLESYKDVGMEVNDLGMFEELLDARSLFLTPNTSTPYGTMEINVKDGPIVVIVPPNVLGPINDALFRHVTDFGVVGPDQGKGGKYLFLHESYEGYIPDGYFVVKTPTYRNMCFFRGFVSGDNLAEVVGDIKASFRQYPLAKADNPPEQRCINLTGKQFNSIHSNDFSFYEELNAVVQYEPAGIFGPQLTGILASIGIKKGQKFAPDARMKRLLTEAVAIGNAAARSMVFDSRKRSIYYYPDRQWFASFVGSHDFMDGGELVLDDRVLWHYIATGVTPAMSTPKVGSGSVYPAAARDSDGNYLDGGKTYSVTLPSPVPMNNFWAFTAYDGQTRSLLETNQRTAGIDSNSKALKPNPDGSYTVWFSPNAPEGKEGNWVQTVQGKNYFVFLRLYGPLEAWFDKSWKPGDFELVK